MEDSTRAVTRQQEKGDKMNVCYRCCAREDGPVSLLIAQGEVDSEDFERSVAVPIRLEHRKRLEIPAFMGLSAWIDVVEPETGVGGTI